MRPRPPPRLGWTRREFAAGGASLLGAALLGAAGRGCKAPRLEAGAPARERPTDVAPPRGLPLLDVAGAPHEIGRAIGRRFREEIRTWIARRRTWVDDLARYAENAGRPAFDEMIRAARERAPAALEEARGLADGAGLDFRLLMALNCKPELEAAQRTLAALPRGSAGVRGAVRREAPNSPPAQQTNPDASPGCSTIVAAGPDRILVAHNEDGDGSYEGLMFLVRVRPPSGVRFLAVTYPGLVPGNAPAINDRGLVVVTNFIGTVAWRPGVPRYFLHRMALEAASVDEAIRIAADPNRGYSFHHVIAAPEGDRLRAVAIEATPTRSEVRELSGAYVHTNHLILDSLRDEPQFSEYVERSSMPRYHALTAATAGVSDPSDLDADALARMLSSHEGRPFSPCRHPQGEEARGTTVACAVFDVGARRARIYPGNPCLGSYAEYDAPSRS